MKDWVLENHRSRSSYFFCWPVNWYSCTRRAASYDSKGVMVMQLARCIGVARADAFGQGTHFRFGSGSRILLMVTLRWTGLCRWHATVSSFLTDICPLLISLLPFFFLFKHLHWNLIKRINNNKVLYIANVSYYYLLH